MTVFASSIDGEGREIYIRWVEVGDGMYDILDKGSNPLYRWATHEELGKFIEIVSGGDRTFFDSIVPHTKKQKDYDFIRRSVNGDRRTMEEATEALRALVEL